ncbi:hypothetical protein [Tautonia marina]|uniref:hypothetical protein n=1 Tax=Tautonia marina TaxID=2653855 RepID=UPI001260D871|nr:hypothetical protein [Tautonia marina]
MATRQVIRDGLASLVRAMSVAGFLAVAGSVAATSGPIGWASWRRAGLGWRFWSGLGTMGAAIAAVALIVCLALMVGKWSDPKGRIIRLILCGFLSILTLIMSLFVPAINAV